MSVFVGAAAAAQAAGASATTAGIVGGAAEAVSTVAMYNEFSEPSEGHVSVNKLHDVAPVASERLSDMRPPKKLRSIPNSDNVLEENVLITLDQMEGMDRAYSSSDSSTKRLKSDHRPTPTLERISEQIDSLLADTPRSFVGSARDNYPPPPDSPDDSLRHVQAAGFNSASSWKSGSSTNWFVAESQGHPVESISYAADGTATAQSYGLWSWDLSLSQFRYKKPTNVFLSMYRCYRIRKVQVHFYPIDLDTVFVTGTSKKSTASNAEDLASAVFTSVEQSVFDPTDFSSEMSKASVPRVGPVAACFIPMFKDAVSREDLSSYSFAEFAKSFDAKIFAPKNGCLPEIRLEYEVPLDPRANMAGWRDPHPEARYRSVDATVVNQTFPRLGTFWLRTSQTLKGSVLYHTRVRVLVECMSLLDVHISPLQSLATGSRRLSSEWTNPDSGSLEDANENNIVDNQINNNNSGDATMQASINTNSTNIATLTASLATLTNTVNTMNTTLTTVADTVSHFSNSEAPAPTFHPFSESPYPKSGDPVSGTTYDLTLLPSIEDVGSFYDRGSYSYDLHHDAQQNVVYHVKFRGQLFTTNAKFSTGVNVIELPVRFRPSRQLQFLCPTMNYSSTGQGFCNVQISNMGLVSLYQVDGSDEAYVYLDNISYWTA